MKALSDITLHKLSEMIEEKIEEYRKSNKRDERKKLADEYIEMAMHYNSSAGLKVYKLNL